MTLQECTAILAPFALALRAEMDDPTFRAYHRVLKDIPAPLLHAAVDAAAREADLKWFPTAPEWRGRCEWARRRLMELHPYRPCQDCNGVGTVKISRPGELRPRYGKCRCWTAYLKRMASVGVTPEPVAQVPAERVVETEDVALAVDDLPPAMSDRVRAIAAHKVLR